MVMLLPLLVLCHQMLTRRSYEIEEYMDTLTAMYEMPKMIAMQYFY